MSNKTPKANAAKTASAPKIYQKLFIAVLVGGVLLSLFAALTLHNTAHRLTFGGRSFSYETAVTQQQQELGLSYRRNLAKNAAMLFVFPKPAIECFWMKDMNFPLDMIWLDANKRVVHIEQNAPPSSYPNSFCPIIPSQYVIEVNAGTISATGLKIGDPVSF